ncbi:RNA polymerase sigma factor [Flavihumibacter solisilvae]|uniref:RNA polymerase sigma factor n=1 Tax=Flavihumibacter solisilvae TaxID=1349421 RepID=UPI00068C4F5F|nr:sigma-70 family RNA polymerase sigma factor [Flavihumibacter solisilvae]
MLSHDPYENVESLLPAFRSGCEAALTRLYGLLKHRLRSYALRLTREADAADDIIAESFFKLWERRAQMESIKGLKAYLYTMIRHACFKYLQAKSKAEQAHEEWNYLSQFGLETEEGEIRVLQQIRQEISSMPAKMQVVFNLSYIDGLRAAEVARRLSLSVHTIQTQKKRALKRIRCALAKGV